MPVSLPIIEEISVKDADGNQAKISVDGEMLVLTNRADLAILMAHVHEILSELQKLNSHLEIITEEEL